MATNPDEIAISIAEEINKTLDAVRKVLAYNIYEQDLKEFNELYKNITK